MFVIVCYYCDYSKLLVLTVAMQEEYGPIYKTDVLGDTMVWLHSPADVRTVLARDGPSPVLPSMETFTQLRQQPEYSHVFGGSEGLISQGDSWRSFRTSVQQDMMCPSAADHYTGDIEEIAEELVETIRYLNGPCHLDHDHHHQDPAGLLRVYLSISAVPTVCPGVHRQDLLRGGAGGAAGIQGWTRPVDRIDSIVQDATGLKESMGQFMKGAMPMIFLPLKVQHKESCKVSIVDFSFANCCLAGAT